ncbi:shikimate dehydrogenase family protein [Aquabacter spiritensis]|uniref:shikimate dehydrogenase (NADP(+)) n=1 Tax=Aquabacter spiritensis TaxID=933073 RepID=A0A4R3M354_9HYPH|nr:shikimate dehydrogenase [Aquabacter spiritensis]TCT05707.1 shikimate dehydrogenase [Aquabacter spiritensis]
MVAGNSRLYAIIGDPIAHVRTPLVFNAYFAAHEIAAVCVPIHIRPEDLAAGMAGLKAIANLDGFIVTAPHKARVAQMVERLGQDGALVGAVNTVRREADGSYSGTMLDGHGFVAGLAGAGHAVRGRSIYIAGAGGAAAALAFALAAAGIRALTVFNRTRERAEDLLARVKAAFPAVEVRFGTRDPRGHDIAVNATPLGLEPGDGFSFDVARAEPPMLVAEVLMKPETTALLRAAAARGCAIHQGKHMLDGQRDLMMAYFGLAPDVGTRSAAAR